MPTYEYRCPKGHEFEKFQRMSEPPTAQCPGCGQEATRLLSGGAGLLFKGDGFYITDYRSDSYKKAADSDKPGGKSGAPEPGGSADKGAGGKSDTSPSGSGGGSGGSPGSGSGGTGGSGSAKDPG